MSDFENQNPEDNNIQDSGYENTGSSGEQNAANEDGRYSYGGRSGRSPEPQGREVEDDGSYRRPSYWREDVSGRSSSDSSSDNYSGSSESRSYGNSSSDNYSRNSGSYGSSSYGNSDSRSYGSSSSDNYSSSSDSSYNGSSSDSGRYSYDNRRSQYSYDNNGRSGSGSSRGRGRSPKKDHRKTIAIVVAAAVVIGGLVGGACWAVGSLVGNITDKSAAASGPVIGTESSLDESTTAAASGETAAADSGNSTIATEPAAENSADSSLITDIPDVVDLCMPSIVAISTKYVYEYYNTYGYNPYFGYEDGSNGSSTYEAEGAGSGIIIGDDGTELWIVTNNHVVEDSDEVTVGFNNGTNVAAYIKGTDTDNDLAVVGVKLADIDDETKSTIQAIRMGDSDSLRLGETVIAIGNALGIGQSVTTGIVSALNREITTSDGATLNTLQTDAAINPGNSGGALLNSKGELIGINVAKDVEEDVEGMGYAIPISQAKDIIENLTTMEPRVPVSEDEYPYIGVQLKDINSSYATAYNIPTGVLVYSVEENSPAEEAGMLQQDIITKINGVTVSSYDDLQEELQYYAGGTTVTITVQRIENGTYSEKELTVKLGLKSDYQTSTEASTEADSSNSSNGYSNGSGGFNFQMPGNSQNAQ